MRNHRRFVSWSMLIAIQILLILGGASCLHPAFELAHRPKPPKSTPVDQLKSTTIAPHLSVKLVPECNLLWCGTFQMAWNECVKLTGGPLRFVPDAPLAADMNRQEFRREYADESNCVVVADFVRNDVYGQIERALRAKASPSDYASHQPDRTHAVRPQDIVAYAYLQTDLRFPLPFERLDNRLTFLGTRVAAFGIGPERKTDQERLYPQVWIHEYRDRNDFVVELDSGHQGDRLILAKIKPGETLLATIQGVEKRLVTLPASRNPACLTEKQKEQVQQHIGISGDVLMIPKMAFDLTRRYSELIGRFLVPARKSIAGDLQLQDAVQTIRFEMDERGVELRSSSQMSFGCSATPSPPNNRWMVFDGPFLLMLQREKAPLPYFAVWIANTGLLQE